MCLISIFWVNYMVYNQGKYNIPNQYRHKYFGDKENICYRSGWELDFMKYLSRNENVLAWNSEDVIISYFNPIKNKKSRYFMDFWFRYKDKNNNIHEVLVEVKPFAQTQEPVLSTTKTGKNTKKRQSRYYNQLMTYEVNRAKWSATYEHCRKHNQKFYILTDDIHKSSRYQTRYKLWSYNQLILEKEK